MEEEREKKTMIDVNTLTHTDHKRMGRKEVWNNRQKKKKRMEGMIFDQAWLPGVEK